MGRHKRWLIGLGLVTLTVLAFSGVGGLGFVDYDDECYVTANARVTGGLSPAGAAWAFRSFECANWHPLTWLSLQADASLFGAGPLGFHLTSLALHALAALLLFLALQRMTGATWRAAAVAALFAVHPLRVESVAWVSERKDVLSACLAMATLYAYARWVGHRERRWYVIALVAFALGLLAKPMLVALPFALLLFDSWPLRRHAALREKVPFFALSAGSCLATLFAQRAGDAIRTLSELPWGLRLGNVLVSYVGYLDKTLYPRALFVPYAFPIDGIVWWKWLSALLLLAAISAAVFRFRRSAPYLLVGWLFYLGILVPASGLVPIGLIGGADRYSYLPSVGLLIAVVWLVAERLPRPAPFVAAAAVLAGILLTRAQVPVWRDTESLWNHTVRHDPTNVTAHYHLANWHFERRDERSGARELQLVVEHCGPARRLRRATCCLAARQLAILLSGAGHPAQALPYFRSALAWDPESADLRKFLGVTLVELGQANEGRMLLNDGIQRAVAAAGDEAAGRRVRTEEYRALRGLVEYFRGAGKAAAAEVLNGIASQAQP